MFFNQVHSNFVPYGSHDNIYENLRMTLCEIIIIGQYIGDACKQYGLIIIKY